MLSLLFGLVIVIVVIGFLFWLLDKAPISEPFKTIARGVCVFVLIIYLLYVAMSFLGVAPTGLVRP